MQYIVCFVLFFDKWCVCVINTKQCYFVLLEENDHVGTTTSYLDCSPYNQIFTKDQSLFYLFISKDESHGSKQYFSNEFQRAVA